MPLQFPKIKRNTIIFFILSLLSLILLIPAVQTIIVSFANSLLQLLRGYQLRRPEKWAKVIYKAGISCSILSFVIAFSIQFLNFNAVRISLKDFNINNILLFSKTVFILWILFMVSIISIIRANYLYIDDTGRNLTGYTGWTSWGRYVSEFASYFVHANFYLTDISPLTQMIAALFMAISGCILLFIFTGKTKYKWFQLIAVLPIGISPYFLECFSYKFDSTYMALSVLTSVIPFIFYTKKSGLYIVTSFIGLFITCTTYQASLGIFPMIVMFIVFLKWLKNDNGKNILLFLVKSIIPYICSVGIYAMIAPKHDTYANNTMNLFAIPSNYKNYYSAFFNDFNFIWLCFLCLIILSFLYIHVRDTKRNKIFTLIFAIGITLWFFLLAFGLYPALDTPIFEPRAMYGIGIVIALLMIGISMHHKAIIAKISCISLVWCFFTFAFTYGNTLVMQEKYTTFRVESIWNDLKEIPQMQSTENKRIAIRGHIGLAPSIINASSYNPLLARLVPNLVQEGWYWSAPTLIYQYGVKNIEYIYTPEDTFWYDKHTLPLLVNTMFHSIYGNDTQILIELKE